MLHYVMVKFDNGKSGPCHPTEMEYLGRRPSHPLTSLGA